MALLDDAHATDFIKHLELFEGRTNYLYNDSVSMPTTGVGCAIPSASVCQSLNWPGGQSVVDLAASEWQIVKNYTPGLMASAYMYLTTLRLPDMEIDKLRDHRIDGAENDVIRGVQGVMDFPMCVRECLLDMSFNLGISRLRSQYFGPTSRFGPALYRGDWQTAAAESARRGIQPARNEYVRDLIMQAYT